MKSIIKSINFIRKNKNFKTILKKTKKYYIGKENNKFIPSDVATIVIKFLDKKFKNVMDYGFTASIENEFDGIAEGEIDWSKMLKDFYSPFKKERYTTLFAICI